MNVWKINSSNWLHKSTDYVRIGLNGIEYKVSLNIANFCNSQVNDRHPASWVQAWRQKLLKVGNFLLYRNFRVKAFFAIQCNHFLKFNIKIWYSEYFLFLFLSYFRLLFISLLLSLSLTHTHTHSHTYTHEWVHFCNSCVKHIRI